jgi:hypothetical protein
MTARFPIAALALASLVLAAGPAHALSFRTRQCVSAARAARGGCIRQCTEDFRTNFATCFGPGSACAAACITEQGTCQTPYALAKVECTRNCNGALRTALSECAGQLDPALCADAARMQAINCTSGCAVAAAGPLQTCSTQFQDCIQSCASQR